MNANVVVFKWDKKPRVQLIVRTYVRGKMSKINKGRKKQNKINVKRGKQLMEGKFLVIDAITEEYKSS